MSSTITNTSSQTCGSFILLFVIVCQRLQFADITDRRPYSSL